MSVNIVQVEQEPTAMPVFHCQHGQPAADSHRRSMGSGMFVCHRNYELEAIVIATKRRLENRDLAVRQG